MREVPVIYRNQSIDLQSKSVHWFLYDRDLHHERVKALIQSYNVALALIKISQISKRVLILLGNDYFYNIFKMFAFTISSKHLSCSLVVTLLLFITQKLVSDRLQISLLILSEFKRIN